MDKKELFMKYALHTPYNFNVNVAKGFFEEKEQCEQILKWVGKQGNSVNGAVLRSMVDSTTGEHPEGDGAEYPAAGLYQTGSNYTVMLKSWDELLAEGVVHVDNGAVYTNMDTNSYVNNSSDALAGDLMLPNDGSIITLAESAFDTCKQLTGVNIPDSVTSIGDYAFYDCNALKNATFISDAPELGSSVFNNCSSEFVINYYVCTTGWDTFPWTDYVTKGSGVWVTDVEATCTTEGSRSIVCSHCNKTITEVIPPVEHNYVNDICSMCGKAPAAAGLYETGSNYNVMKKSWDELLAEDVVHVDNGAVYTNIDFSTYTNSSSAALAGDLVLPNDGSITALGNYDINTYSGNTAFTACTELTGIKIPNSVTSIGAYSFYDCTSLTSINIPNSVTNIGEGAFSNCGLTSIEIPDSITKIEDKVFESCSELQSVVFPLSVKQIGAYAFRSCNKLTSISYVGTIAQWKYIFVGRDWCNGVLATYVKCSDGTFTNL